MANRTRLYTQLPGVGTGGFLRARLWLGPDHLLQVGSSGVGERYRRFYFADIQAFAVCQTLQWAVGSVILFAIVAGFGLAALASGDATLRGVFLGIAVFFILVLIIHLSLGPTCVCQVQTAVQTENLPSLKRLRNARKVLARVRPLIEAAQASKTAATPLPS